MKDPVRDIFTRGLRERFGDVRKLPGSQSLYEIPGKGAVFYLRYSKLHSGNRTFFGLRKQDLRRLQARAAYIALLWEKQEQPLVIPFAEYEDVFDETPPAPDGQYKVQVYLRPEGTQLYIANVGRFNVEDKLGWGALAALETDGASRKTSELAHNQVQTLLGAIGSAKGYDIWVPPSDRAHLDWSIAARFRCRNKLAAGFGRANDSLAAVDVMWLKVGGAAPIGLFEVEHTTPIYSGLLRFNDIHLVAPTLDAQFTIVGHDVRRGLFARQLRRPTFSCSGLQEVCTFLDYTNVYGWYERMIHANNK